MENLSPKIVGIYRLHSTALAIDKWYIILSSLNCPPPFSRLGTDSVTTMAELRV